MADIVVFSPRTTNDAQANLCDFINLCREKIKPFGRDINFDEDVWDVSGLGGKSQRCRSYFYFSPLSHKLHCGASAHKNIKTKISVAEPFLSFAKAMIIYMHAMRPTKAIRQRYIAFLYFEAALYETNCTNNPIYTTPQILNRACTLMLERLTLTTAYSVAKQLELIFELMRNHGILTATSNWKSLLQHPRPHRNRIGKEFDEERYKKLPNPRALEALAQIFTSDLATPREIAFSSMCALMLCAPDRITEVLHLPFNCLTQEWKDPESEATGIGLRWFPLKGAAPMIKTVIPSMKDVATRAISQLKQISKNARLVALWYEANPTKLYLPAHLEYLRDKELLSMNELGLILYNGNCGKTTAREWAKRHKLPLTGGGIGIPRHIAFQDVEKQVLAMLPDGFPIMDQDTGMRYSEALCITCANELDLKNAHTLCIIAPIKYPAFRQALKSTETLKSIFEERGFTDENGTPLFISSHMLRHYLNTLARQGGKLSEEDIAMWSGRKNIRHNAVYNHVSDRDMLAHIRNAIGNPSLAIGPLANIDNRIFISRDKFAEIKVVTAHTTEYGYCIHDFAMLPCQIHGDCINCNEQVCVKGDIEAEARLRQLYKETLLLLEKAQAAMAEHEYGANEWVQHQTMTLKRVEQLISILDDPKVPSGAVIQLSNDNFASRITQAIQKRQPTQKNELFSKTFKSIEDVSDLLNKQ